MKSSVACFTLTLLGAACAPASAPPVTTTRAAETLHTPFGYAQLHNLITDNNVTTIEQLLPLLPLDYRSGYTFIYASRGQHAANVFPDQPRVLLYGSDARFMMVFAKNPNSAPVVSDADSLQTIEWNPVTLAFVLRQIDFSPGKKPLDPEPADNPATCLTCHGNDPRPIFDVYNFWPGFYGSVGRELCDTMQTGTPELTGYTAFQSQHRHADRYQFLPAEKPITKDTGCPSDPSDEVTVSNAASTSPNEDLTDMIFALNEQRIRRTFEAVPVFTAYEPLLTAIGGQCFAFQSHSAVDDIAKSVEGFFPPNFATVRAFDSFQVTRQNLIAQSRADFGKRLARFNLNNRASTKNADRLPINFNDDQDKEAEQFAAYNDAALLKLVADRMGVDMTDLSPNFRDGVFEFTSAGHFLFEILGQFNRDGQHAIPFSVDVCETLQRQSLSSF
jgi:hypothetical protein